MQDKQGFLWIATEEGLSRFDGSNFLSFHRQPGKPDSLSSNVITDIAIAENGIIWLTTDGGGVNRLDPVTLKFQRVGEKSLPSVRFQSIFIDSHQRVWVGGYDSGVSLIRQMADDFQISNFARQQVGTERTSITSFAEDNQQRIWIGSKTAGIAVYDSASGEWRDAQQLYPEAALSSLKVNALLYSEQGNIVIGTVSNGVMKLNLATAEFEKVDLGVNVTSTAIESTLSLMQDSQNTIWIGTDDGLVRYSRSQPSKHYISSRRDQGLSSNRILSLHEDRSGVIWVGTFKRLNKLLPISVSFNHVIPETKQGEEADFITSFATDEKNKRLYVGTYGQGLLEIETEHYSVEGSFSMQSGLPDDRVMTVQFDSQANLWVGTRSQGIALKTADRETWQYFKKSDAANSLPANGVTDILEDSNGNTWISTYNGGLSLKTPQGFLNYTAETDGLVSNRIRQIVESSDNELWIATDDGISRFNTTSRTFENYSYDPAIAHGLSAHTTWHIFERSNGDFWVATEGGGVNVWSKSNRDAGIAHFEHLNRENGLRSNTVYGINEDNSGFIWISHNKGLSRIDPETFESLHFDTRHGIQGYDFVDSATYHSPDGILYFGGTNGFNYFSDDIRLHPDEEPSVALLSVSNLKGVIRQQQTESLTELKHNNKFLKFDFVALDFRAPEENRYKYRLEGFDSAWIEAGNNGQAVYTNLPPGEFRFMVKVATQNSGWSDAQVLHRIKVNPAPWLSVWAFIGYALLLIALFSANQYRQHQKVVQNKRLRNQLEQEIADRTRQLENQNTALARLNKELKQAYNTDAQTGLKNRHFLHSYIQAAQARVKSAHLQGGRSLPYLLIAIIDMDNLKQINDRFGHSAGDRAISCLAESLVAGIPEDFHLIRWGGDEFMLVGTGTSKSDMLEMLSALKESLQQIKVKHFNDIIGVDCSAGFSFYPFLECHIDELSWEQSSEIADKALYLAKTGRQAWHGVMGVKVPFDKKRLDKVLRSNTISEYEDMLDIVDIE